MTSLPNIVFDLDGTLVDSAPSLCKAGNFLLNELGRPEIDVETYKTFIGKGMLKQIEQLLIYTGGLPADGLDKYFKLFREFYEINALSSTTTYDGVHEALESLKALPSKLAICTQKMERPARTVLAGLNLQQYFDGFAFGDSLSVMKPHAEMVEHSLNGFETGPLIYVGDSETDSLTAQNSGAIFLLFSGGYRLSSMEKIKNFAVFDKHVDLCDLVKEVLSQAFDDE